MRRFVEDTKVPVKRSRAELEQLLINTYAASRASAQRASDMLPDVTDRRFIAALANISERSVLKIYRNPARCWPGLVARVRHAALKLNVAPPAAKPP